MCICAVCCTGFTIQRCIIDSMLLYCFLGMTYSRHLQDIVYRCVYMSMYMYMCVCMCMIHKHGTCMIPYSLDLTAYIVGVVFACISNNTVPYNCTDALTMKRKHVRIH